MSGYLGRVIAVAALLGVMLALAGPSAAAPPSGPGATPGRQASPPQKPPKIMQLNSWHDKPGALFSIKGEGFIKTSKVVWKSADNKGIQTLDVTYVSASELRCKVPSNAVPGPYLVGVDNGGGLASNLSNFLVVKP